MAVIMGLGLFCPCFWGLGRHLGFRDLGIGGLGLRDWGFRDLGIGGLGVRAWGFGSV